MAFQTGFFTRTELKSKKSRNTDAGVSIERMREIGISGLTRMNPDAETKNMLPVGDRKPDVYILGSHPTLEEDRIGRPFASKAAQTLRDILPSGYKIRFNNVCRTLPPIRAGVRKPLPYEIAGYYATTLSDIESSHSVAILALGAIPTGWLLGETVARAGIDNVRGRRFPALVGKCPVWVYPTWEPGDILKREESQAYSAIPAAEYRRYFVKDVERVFDEIEKGLPTPVIESANLADSLKGVLIEKKSVNVIQNFLAEMRDERAATIDLETSCFRPYTDGAKILTQAIGTGKRVIAFPWKHKDATWTKSEFARLREVVGNFLVSKVPKIAHNAPFEVEWLLTEFGNAIAWESYWHCTMGQAYLIDERPSSAAKKKGGQSGGSGISLDFCTVWHLGLNLKSIEKIDRSNLANTNLDLVLRYDGRDTKYTGQIYVVQKKILKENNLWEAYLQWGKRVPCLAKAQVIGVPVSQPVNEQLRKKVGGEMVEAMAEVKNTDAVKKFEKLHGPYIDSNKNNILLFRKMLGYEKETTRKGKITADEQALTAMKDEPAAVALLKYRTVSTLMKTYLTRMDAKAKDTFIFPDGRAHCSYKHAATDTKRIQAEEPSLLNQPRESGWIKTQYVAEPGCVFLEADYGAQEARCIAASSKDPNLVKFMHTGEDFHMTWAEKIVRKYDKTYKAFTKHLPPEKKMKEWRQRVKAQWVFAGFYHAKVGTRANYLDMPIRIAQELDDEFWDKRDGFAGVKTWQKSTIRNYHENGYVTSMGGHRRHGPMSESQIVNCGVQASGTDVTVDAWYRVSRYAYEHDLEWLYIPLFVHDSLDSFTVPIKKRDQAIDILASIMCDVQLPGAELFPWEIEIKSGMSWGDKKDVGVFSTDKVEKQLKVFRQSGAAGLRAYNDSTKGK